VEGKEKKKIRLGGMVWGKSIFFTLSLLPSKYLQTPQPNETIF